MLKVALGEFGVREFAADQHNPRILEYAREIGLGPDIVSTDEFEWCGIFMGYCAQKSGLEIPETPFVARKWLKAGEETNQPEAGDIVVFWREARGSWKGHVGLFCSYSEDRSRIYVLGGNQGNSVSIKPYSTRRVLGFRRHEGLSV